MPDGKCYNIHIEQWFPKTRMGTSLIEWGFDLMPASTELRGFSRVFAIILCFVFGGAIGLAGYYMKIPLETRTWLRLGLCAVFLVGLFVFRQSKPIWETCLAFWAVITGILGASLIGNHFLDWLLISPNDARGYAVSKFSEVLPIILIILLLLLLRGRDLKEFYLYSGKVGLSLLGGLAVGVVLFAYFLSQGGWQVFQGGNLVALLPMIGWVTVFSILNGFMEELWFRGLFLSRFEQLLGPRWAFWLTSLLFGLLHAFGAFTGTLGSLLLTLFTLLLGMAFGFIVQRTKSIWGAVLGHFFADFFMMLGYFSTTA
jgi:membrane protease YdiL (CAAX protease family)